jgi:hypothetical protein
MLVVADDSAIQEHFSDLPNLDIGEIRGPINPESIQLPSLTHTLQPYPVCNMDSILRNTFNP